MAMVVPGLTTRRGSKDDGRNLLRLKNSNAERVRSTQWKVDDKLLEKELRMIEKDRKRTENLYYKNRFGLSMELKDLRKEALESQTMRNETSVVVGDGSLIRINKQRIRERRLSLPINLLARPSSAVMLNSDGTLSNQSSRPPTASSRGRQSRPGSSAIPRRGVTPLSSEDILRNRKVLSLNGYGDYDDDDSNSDDYDMRRRYSDGRLRSCPNTAEMTPDDVKLSFLRRTSMKDMDDVFRMQTPKNAPEDLDIQAPRSRLRLRRQSMPDIQRARTAMLLGTTPHMEPIGEVNNNPVNDPRFRNLMGSLTKQFDKMETRTRIRPKTAATEVTVLPPTDDKQTKRPAMMKTHTGVPYKTGRRQTSVF